MIASEVLIPPMVHRELLGKIGVESERIDKALNDFISVTDLKPMDSTIKEALADLDEGERQVIGLASAFSEDILLLLDDRAGRLVAEKLNIPIYHRSYIQLCEGVTLYGESLEVKVPFGGASKYEGCSESEHLLEASL